ncbi:MAG: carboxypeptidase-like regulatory domain-containing protein [Candidatus Bathyarchaeota archaeon]|nr:carboxypeptidase regulatory-like domain-containing protein [Candidatus Bathyarchaeota archaeon A05DMB-5]MDH7558404.1 carboxypeptidase-like regulatory domain-containing protein [Candidatus Bathyarchaeota archaeon]
MIYAQASPPHGFGIPIPQFVKDELNFWIDYIQNDVNGDDMDGGSGYDNPDSWVNILKTGTLLQEMAFVGDTLATPRVQDAIDYIERHWNDFGYDYYGTGWKGNPLPNHKQAMYTTMKGFEAFNINLLDLDGDNTPEHDWFNEMADALLAEQFPAGNWNYDVWAYDYILPTCWALLTLEKAAPPVAKYDLTVKVIDANTLDPISGAMVTANGPEYREDFTGLDGKVKFEDLLAGGYSVGASKTGYVPASVMVEVSEDTEITIRLVPEGPPQPVGGYEVPPNILTLIAPWIFLGFAISVGTIAVARRKMKY